MNQTISPTKPRQEHVSPIVTAKARVFRLWLDITDAEGITYRYCVVPLALADRAKAFRLTKYNAAGTLKVPCEPYTVAVGWDGVTACTCPAGRSGRSLCKHVRVLTRAGILDTEILAEHQRALLIATQDAARAEAAERVAARLTATPPDRTAWPTGATL